MASLRVAALLSGISLVDAVIVSLAQTGLVSRLPQPSGRAFDTMRVVRSRVAYPLGVPDTLLAIGNHAANLVLLRAAGATSGRNRLATTLLRASVTGGAVGALFYAYQMAFRVRKVCPYCVVAISCNLGLAVVVWRALRVAAAPRRAHRVEDERRREGTALSPADQKEKPWEISRSTTPRR